MSEGCHRLPESAANYADQILNSYIAQKQLEGFNVKLSTEEAGDNSDKTPSSVSLSHNPGALELSEGKALLTFTFQHIVCRWIMEELSFRSSYYINVQQGRKTAPLYCTGHRLAAPVSTVHLQGWSECRQAIQVGYCS